MGREKIESILIIHTYGIGDMLLFTPVLNQLRQLYPEAVVDILITQGGSKIPVQYRNDIREIFTMTLSVNTVVQTALKLRKKHYDLSIVTGGGKPWKAMLFSFLTGARKRIGEVLGNGPSLYTDPVIRKGTVHRCDSNLNLLEPLTDIKNIAFENPTFSLPENLENYGEEYLSKHNILGKTIFGIHPGSNREFSFKRWPKEYFAAVINELTKLFPQLTFLLFIGPDEIEEGEYLESNCDVIAVREPSLEQVAAVVMSCDFFFNSDSGLGHIATCNPECHIFTIIGPAEERVIGPRTKHCSIIKKGLPCQSCNPDNRKMNFTCQFECLRDLSPEDVLNTMIPVIKKRCNF